MTNFAASTTLRRALPRTAFTTFAAVAVTLLAGCAGISTLRSEVSSFGEWPAGRVPGTYAFERLPSQQARTDLADRLEAAAALALGAAGFKPAAAGSEPEVIVQLGARSTRTDASPWDDPLWWRGGAGVSRWRYGPWTSPRWGLSLHIDSPRFEREVALLLRDRVSGKPLYETRASNDGSSVANSSLMAAMFRAALKDFPSAGPNPRPVDVPLVFSAQ